MKYLQATRDINESFFYCHKGEWSYNNWVAVNLRLNIFARLTKRSDQILNALTKLLR
jgi:hypothetical protein